MHKTAKLKDIKSCTSFDSFKAEKKWCNEVLNMAEQGEVIWPKTCILEADFRKKNQINGK